SGVRLAVPWVRIPPSPPETKNAPCGRFAFLGEWVAWTNPLVRQFCREQNWTAAGWPRAQRGVRLRDAPNNPTLSAIEDSDACAHPRMRHNSMIRVESHYDVFARLSPSAKKSWISFLRIGGAVQ